MQTLRSGFSAAVLALTLSAAASPATSASVLNVNWGEGCGKATCFDDSGVYRKTFSARDFTGPVTIGQLLMQRGVLGTLDSALFSISFALNGEDLGSWGHWMMGGIGGDELGFTGPELTWNPEDGDLVLILTLSPLNNAFRWGGGGGGFSGAPPEPIGSPFGEPEPFGGPGPGPNPDGPGSPRGPVQMTAVPEPATWAMMITGFGLAGAILRRRRVDFGQP